jgi:hypothetical protein
LEIPESKGQHAIKGGKTIIGKLFAYQERTGASLKDTLNTPYIMFVLGMLDAPSIDYGDKKSKENKPSTAADEISAITGALG